MDEYIKQIAGMTDEKLQIELMLDVVDVMRSYINTSPVIKTTSIFNVKKTEGTRHGDMWATLNGIVAPTTVSFLQYCHVCNSSNISYDTSTGDDVCMDCGVCTVGISSELDYNDEKNVDKHIVYSYKRENHFNEWINQFQAKENTTLPPNLISDVSADLKKQRITKPSDITQKKVKELLRKLGYNKYYEHVPYITTVLNGTKPPTIPPELEEKLRNMFHAIQVPFDKFCPGERTNFLSYSYVLYKFCELLGKDEYLDYFPLLKSREKLYRHDQIWKKITAELKWQWIPTI